MRKSGKKKYKVYTVNHDYFKTWSHDMAYVLGFIVADGNIQKDGNYVKVEVKPDDVAVLEFIRDQITPGYILRQSRPSEIRWYPASITLKQDLAQLGVVPAKTGKEMLPPNLPDIFFWDFVRGLFDGDGSVSVCSVDITSHCNCLITDLWKKTGLGRVRQDRMNWRWEIEDKCDLRVFFNAIYASGSFCLVRKKEKISYLLDTPKLSGRFSPDEDRYLLDNYMSKTRLEMAMCLGRSGLSVKNRLRKLSVRRKEGVPFAVLLDISGYLKSPN